ncbi:hypothetical protein FEQ00_06343 [Burkholderia pseudomultivorans]|uniref:Uncharacterized protein n=1 Tax=Burkholderia pseudomultivorans TaxID=1207504 RepID=A0ABU2EE76_9BURK|nr:hypothetical protein [Burkholderia pseudomultivorans]
MLAGLVARHVVVVGDLEAVPAHMLDARHAELAPVRVVRGEDTVVGIDDDHRLRILFEIGDERAHVGREFARRNGNDRDGVVRVHERLGDDLPVWLPILP